MPNTLPNAHWFDKDLIKLLDRYEIEDEASQACLLRAVHLAQSAFQVDAALIILGDFQSYKIKTKLPITEEVEERLFDLAHVLKEVDPEYWHRFANEPFFLDLDMWVPIADYRFFCSQAIENEHGVALGWICLFDKKDRFPDAHMLSTLHTMADMVMDELELRLQIRRSNRLQNEIIHLAAHDLKNPLSGILGITDHIKKQLHNTEQLEEICELIKDSSRRMLGILDDILKSGYLESGKIHLRVYPQDFSNVIEEVLHQNKSAAEKKQQSFELNLQPGISALIDKIRMAELLDNLVNNAIKYAPAKATIQIGLYERNGEVVFSIYNPGVGLSEADKTRIFQKFCKLSAKPTGGESSTGLGLSIVKMLAEMHGGSIEAESEGLEHGVRFILRIPALAMAA